MAIIEGKKAPEFALKDAAGRAHALADYRGKHVIVYFYPKDDTPGCTKEACSFRDLWGEIENENAVVIGISPDGGESHEAFARKFELPFTLLSDPDKETMTRYGAYGEKTLYGKKTTGVIRSTVWIDPEGKVVKHWRRVQSAADHPQRVLEALRAHA